MPIRTPHRRRHLLGAATLLGALVLGTGCAAAGERAAGEPLIWAIAGTNLEAGHLDPHRSQLDSSATVARLSLDSLVFVDERGRMHPWLATSWAVEDEGRTVRFELREDVVFHDGTPFNAEAVLANFAHIMAEDTASAQAASMLGGDLYLGTEATGEFSVAVSFSQPFVPLLNNASTAFLGMYSPAALAEHAEDLAAGGPGITVGSGPYRMTELVARDHISYERNPDYAWAPEGVTLPEQPLGAIEVRIVPESSVRVQAINGGEVDVATGFAPGDVADLSADLAVTKRQSPGIPYSLFLNQANGVFADERVRLAFRAALDVDAAVEATFFGELERAWGALSPTTPNADVSPQLGAWPRDEQLAVRLLEEAGWGELGDDGIRLRAGERLSLNWSAWTPVSAEHSALAALFTENLRSVGIELRFEAVEPGEYNARYAAGDFDLTDWSFASIDPDALRAHLHTDGFQNAAHVSDPALDALLERAAGSAEPEVRSGLVGDILQLTQDRALFVPVYLPTLIDAQRPGVTGVRSDGNGWPTFTAAE